MKICSTINLFFYSAQPCRPSRVPPFESVSTSYPRSKGSGVGTYPTLGLTLIRDILKSLVVLVDPLEGGLGLDAEPALGVLVHDVQDKLIGLLNRAEPAGMSEHFSGLSVQHNAIGHDQIRVGCDRTQL